MQTPNDPVGILTEYIMAVLKETDALKQDEPGYPVHYNRAYSAVYEMLARQTTILKTRPGAFPELSKPKNEQAHTR